jgi:hypothetical protein
MDYLRVELIEYIGDRGQELGVTVFLLESTEPTIVRDFERTNTSMHMATNLEILRASSNLAVDQPDFMALCQLLRQSVGIHFNTRHVFGKKEVDGM